MKHKPIAFITGMAGFAGSFLAEELLQHEYQVFGSLLRGESTRNLREIAADVTLVPMDVVDHATCLKVMRKVRPQYVFHLAALASVGQSFDQETQTFRVNFQGTLNMIDAVRRLSSLKRFLFVSSADCYGMFSPATKTLIEGQPLNPVSPYGIAKAAAEQAVRYYHRQHRFPAVISRSFNHAGPRQTDRFVIPAFARQIAEIEAGRARPVLSVGDLKARRDFSDVRDVVVGYRLLMQKGRTGEVYQLCSGRATAMQTILKSLLAMSHRKIRIRTDRNRLRKTDLPVLRGSNRKAALEVGYRPQYTLHRTLQDTLSYWRTEIKRKRN